MKNDTTASGITPGKGHSMYMASHATFFIINYVYTAHNISADKGS